MQITISTWYLGVTAGSPHDRSTKREQCEFLYTTKQSRTRSLRLVVKVGGEEISLGGELVGGETSWWRDDRIPTPKTHPTSTVSRIKPREILHRRHVFRTRCFLHYSKVRFPKYCGKRALQGPKKSWEMSTYRVPKCGRHFVKFDDVTIYPVLVVARTVRILAIC